jgi:hypothetical protein
MLVKIYLILFIFLLSACSGEKYDTSKALNILPEKTDSFIPNPSLKNIPVTIDSPNYYSGNLTRKKLARLSGKISNFEISGNNVCYVKSSRKLECLNLLTSEKVAEIPLFSINSDIKKSNISQVLIAFSGENVIAVTNNGYVAKANIKEKTVNWVSQIIDITTIKPFIYENKAFIFTSSGASNVFDLETGTLLSSTEKYEDPIGINFNLSDNLSPVFIPNANVVSSYYRTDLIFFDVSTGFKVFNISLNESSLDFTRIKTEPAIVRNLLIAATSEKLSGISLANGSEIWSVNANISSNLSVMGNFIFFFDKKTKNLISLSLQNNDIKWKEEMDIKTEKAWIIPNNKNTLLVFNQDGLLQKFNLEKGEEILEEKKQKFYSKTFDYKIINNKIYYTDGRNNLIELE